MPERKFTNNHYVPKWYQKRFLSDGQDRFFYLDLDPDIVENNGVKYKRRKLLKWGPSKCFAQDDLYTTQWRSLKNTDIEQYFFGKIDQSGEAALDFFLDYEIKEGLHESFENLLRYMSVQKLRTPKGLQWIEQLYGVQDRNQTLILLQQLETLHCAIWTECIWQIADCSESNTKFIVSDHPVTVYNRKCFPNSKFCRGASDPDIRMIATQTMFPLSLDKILILTNLSWVRNPYQNETALRPNPDFYHQAVFNGTSIQKGRMLSEEEVMQINYIIKKRAFRRIAAAKKEWLYPENYLNSTHWSKFGFERGYLLMPEPREIHMGGEIFFGWNDGRSEAFSEYGHRPWQKDYKNDRRDERDRIALDRFQGEFAILQGKEWRGWSRDFGNEGPRSDSDEFHDITISKAPKAMRKAYYKYRRKV